MQVTQDPETKNPEVPQWTLVTSHGLVLLFVAAYPDSTMRTIAHRLGITERRVVDIIKDLEAAGLLTVTQKSRRNHYSLDPEARFRHPVLSLVSFSDFLKLWEQSGYREAEEANALEPAPAS